MKYTIVWSNKQKPQLLKYLVESDSMELILDFSYSINLMYNNVVCYV